MMNLRRCSNLAIYNCFRAFFFRFWGNHKIFSQSNIYFCRDSNRIPSEYEERSTSYCFAALLCPIRQLSPDIFPIWKTFTIKQNKHYCANICFLCVCCYTATCFDPFIGSSLGVFNTGFSYWITMISYCIYD
jgi:hypothetical protein